MYDMPNHKERRSIAKSLGLLKKRSKLPFAKYCAELQRAIETGKEIHRKKTEIMYRNLEEQDSARSMGNLEPLPKQISPKQERISKIFSTEGEKRSYNEIAADVEIAEWKNRYGQKY